jgi:hypothetical protein
MTEDPPTPGWFETRCPACGAGRHEACMTIAQPPDPRREPHAARLDRAARIARLGLHVVDGAA